MDQQGDKDGTNETVNRLMEAISMMAMANDEINHVRRNSIKQSLNADYRFLCSSQNAVTGNLFGDNITDQLKTIQESNKVGRKLNNDRPKFGHFPGNRRPFFRIKEFLDKWIQEKRRGKNVRGTFRPYRRNLNQDNRRQ